MKNRKSTQRLILLHRLKDHVSEKDKIYKINFQNSNRYQLAIREYL